MLNDLHIGLEPCILIHIYYHDSSRTQPQLEWKCDVSVLCMLFVYVCLISVCICCYITNMTNGSLKNKESRSCMWPSTMVAFVFTQVIFDDDFTPRTSILHSTKNHTRECGITYVCARNFIVSYFWNLLSESRIMLCTTFGEWINNHFLPDLLYGTSVCRSQFSRHTPLLTVTVLPKWERPVTMDFPGSSILTTKHRASTGTTCQEQHGGSMLPVQASNQERRHCPSYGTLGSHLSTCLRHQERCYRSTQRRSLQSRANQSRVQAFNVSAVTQNLNSTAFVRRKGSFSIRTKKRSPHGPSFFGTFQKLAVARNPATSHGSTKGHIPSQSGPLRTSCKLFAPTALTAFVEDIRLTKANCEPKISTITDGSQTF